MKMRSWLMTALLGGSVLVSTGSFSDAGASSGALRMTPQSNWALSKVANRGGGGDYCTMARRFSNNLILTFARNSNSETSLALDFQRDTLRSGKSYTVILSAGGVSRAYDVNPVSSKAFVIRTGADEDVFDAVRRSGLLDINISGQVYRFVIDDMDGGDGQLGACVASLVEPAAGGASAEASGDSLVPMPGSPYEVQAPTVSNRELEAMRADLGRLRSENERLSSALAASRRDYENRMQETDSSSVVSELREKLNLLERENQALRKSVSVSQDAQISLADREEAIETLEERIAGLESENSRLRKGIESARVQQDGLADISVLQREKDELVKANGDLQAKLDQAVESGRKEQVAAMASLQGAIKKLESENASLQEQLEDTQARLAGAQASLGVEQGSKRLVSELEAQLKVISSQKMALEGEIAALRRESQDFSTLQAEMASVQSELLKAQAENTRLRGELGSLSMARSQDEDAAARLGLEVARLGMRVKELEAENSDLYKSFETARNTPKADPAQAVRIGALEAQVQTLEDRLALAESENGRLQGELRTVLAARDEAKSEQDTQGAMVAGLRAEIDGLRRENATLQNELASARDNNNSRAGEELERQQAIVDGLQRQVTDLQAENMTLQASLERVRAEYQEKMTTAATKPADKLLKMELETLEAKLAAAERSNKRLNQELEAATRGVTDPGQAIASDNWNLEIATRRFSEAESEIRRLGALLDKERSQCSAEIFELEAKLFDPIVTDPAQIERLKSLQSDLEMAQSGHQTCSQRVAQLEKKVSEGQSRLAEVQARAPVPAPVSTPDPVSLPLPLASSMPDEEIASALNAIATGAGDVEVDTRAVVKSAPLKPVSASPLPETVVRETASVVSGGGVPFMSLDEMGGLLRSAGVRPVSGSLETLDSVSGPGFLAFRWDTGEVYGTAEQHVMDNAGQHDSYVARYLDQAKSRCPGDFAAIPAQRQTDGGMTISAYEIACVGDDVDSSASIVFFANGNLFTIIAHETGTEQMDVAMDVRDSILEQVSGSMSAFREGL